MAEIAYRLLSVLSNNMSHHSTGIELSPILNTFY